MNLSNLPAGASAFVDANILVYHLAGHPSFGRACADFFNRVEHRELRALTTTHVMAEVAHKAMLLDASRTFGWPLVGALKRLQGNPQLISQLTSSAIAIEQILKTGIVVLTVAPDAVDDAAGISRQFGLLTNDALVVAVMRAHGLTNLASHDADFDRATGLTRYAPL